MTLICSNYDTEEVPDITPSDFAELNICCSTTLLLIHGKAIKHLSIREKISSKVSCVPCVYRVINQCVFK